MQWHRVAKHPRGVFVLWPQDPPFRAEVKDGVASGRTWKQRQHFSQGSETAPPLPRNVFIGKHSRKKPFGKPLIYQKKARKTQEKNPKKQGTSLINPLKTRKTQEKKHKKPGKTLNLPQKTRKPQDKTQKNQEKTLNLP